MELSITTIKNFSEKNNIIDECEDIAQAFRFLRNLCAENPDFQLIIVKSDNIIENSEKILLKLISSKNCNTNQILCVVVGLQFLANLLVNNRKNQKKIWDHCQELFEKSLESNNERIQHCCLMILYNIFLGNPEILSDLPHPFERILDLAIQENASEYCIFIIDLFINDSHYLNNSYNVLTQKSKLVILEEIKRLCNESSTNESISFNTLQFIINLFSYKMDWILNQMKTEENFLNVMEIILLLDILVACSSDDKKDYLKVFQKETSLFINCISILKAIHILSKEKDNYFSSKTKMSDLIVSEFDTLSNPVIGFKSKLIRLIGNLCWKYEKFQNITRDLECLQVILDCCVIDEKNPFITQWSIYAIHNICENNIENQQILANLSKSGVIDLNNLKDMGIVLNKSDNNTLYMAPL